MSESRAAAADTRHRIPYPNSRPRAIKVIGLGEGGSHIADAVAEQSMRHVQAIGAGGARGNPAGSEGMLQAIADEGSEIGRAIRGADMVFVVAREGDNVALVPAIGQMAHDKGVLVTGVLVQQAAGMNTPNATLDALRAACDMLVMVSDAEYVTEMLGALGA
ncbi:MAG: hypothetical protein ABIS17_17105 [Casimicrobiaceae bacterium]